MTLTIALTGHSLLLVDIYETKDLNEIKWNKDVLRDGFAKISLAPFSSQIELQALHRFHVTIRPLLLCLPEWVWEGFSLATLSRPKIIVLVVFYLAKRGWRNNYHLKNWYQKNLPKCRVSKTIWKIAFR